MIPVSLFPHLQLSRNCLTYMLIVIVIGFNEKKTKYMCFKQNSFNGLFVPTICLNGVPLTSMTSNKYLSVIVHDKNMRTMLLNRFIPEEICLSFASKDVCFPINIVILFKPFLRNAYYRHYLWSKYKEYSHTDVVVAFNKIQRRACLRFMSCQD